MFDPSFNLWNWCWQGDDGEDIIVEYCSWLAYTGDATSRAFDVML